MHARSWPGNVSFFTSCQSSVSNIQPLSRINLNSWAKNLNDIPTCEVAGWSRGGSKRLTYQQQEGPRVLNQLKELHFVGLWKGGARLS